MGWGLLARLISASAYATGLRDGVGLVGNLGFVGGG